MSGQRNRPRTARRAGQRAARKLVRDREKLAALSPGGAADRPLRVGSAAVIEGKATSTPCPLCGGGLELLEHAAVTVGDASLREVRLRCRLCHVARTQWFDIQPPRVN